MPQNLGWLSNGGDAAGRSFPLLFNVVFIPTIPVVHNPFLDEHEKGTLTLSHIFGGNKCHVPLCSRLVSILSLYLLVHFRGEISHGLKWSSYTARYDWNLIRVSCTLYEPPQIFQDSMLSHIFLVLTVNSAYTFPALLLIIRLSQCTLSEIYLNILPYAWPSKLLHSVPNQGLLLPSCCWPYWWVCTLQ